MAVTTNGWIERPEAEQFWGWSLVIYGKPGAQALFLQTQDQHGGDVNLLLLLLWMSAQNAELTDKDFSALIRVSDAARPTLEELRNSRRKAKGIADYSIAKDIELDAEKEAQKALLNALPERIGVIPDASGIMEKYRQHLRAPAALFEQLKALI